MEDAALSAFGVFFTQTPSSLAYQQKMADSCPGKTQVIPLVPEFIRPQDGHDKQDCENAAAKRWLSQHGERLRGLRGTVLGDDLYCHQPFCQQRLDQEVDFILVCREDSHTTLYDHLAGMALPTVTTQRWSGKVQETWTYR
jgi:hypothetical protein